MDEIEGVNDKEDDDPKDDYATLPPTYLAQRTQLGGIHIQNLMAQHSQVRTNLSQTNAIIAAKRM
jgi:hypothetical protein